MAGNETSVNAALRELQEETGLPVRRFWTVPFVNSFYDPAKDCVHLIPVFAADVDSAQEPRLSSEHQRYTWLPYTAARRKLVWPGQQQGLTIVNNFIVGRKDYAALVEIHHPY